MKKIISIFLSLLLLLSMTSCSSDQEKKQYTKSFLDLFDTASSITAFDENQQSFDKHYKTVYDELKRFSILFDIYNSYDNICNLKYINDNAAISPVSVDQDIIELLLYCKKIYTLTDGYINVCMGSVLSLWHESREFSLTHTESAYIPNKDDLKKAASHTSIDNLIIDTKNNTVYFSDKQLKLDVGAVAKGYVSDKIFTFITENNIWQSALINLGGNVKAIGYKNRDNKFKIGIENPLNQDDYIATVDIADGQSVITSGGYQRYYTVDNTNYCHIIDPNTLMPPNSIKSVSIISSDSAKGDSLSTWLFCLSFEEGVEIIEKTPNTEAVWLDNENTIHYSSGLKQYETK